jgi:magnesium-transporting ATPase (P-type)
MLYSVPYWFGIGYNYWGTDLYGSTDPIAITSTVTEGETTKTVTSYELSDTTKMRTHFTILFNTFIFMNVFNSFASRKIGWADYKLHKELFNNKWFFIITIAEVAMQWLIVEFPFFNNIFRTAPLTLGMWLTCLGFGVAAIGVNLLTKKIFEDKEKYFSLFDFKFNETNEKEEGNKILSFADNFSGGF